MTDFETPVLRNDGSTLKERMNSNAYNNVLPARYMEKNKHGDIIENQEEVFERVAKNLAIPDILHIDEPFPDFIPENLTHEHFDDSDYGDYILDGEIEFIEETARYFSYDAIVGYLEGYEYYNVLDELESTKNEFHEKLSNLKMMANTPCLINAGQKLQQLSACFVLDIEDDMRNIHEVAADASEVFQSGGGLGYPFSFLRPYGDVVGSTGGIASGPITFMDVFNKVCGVVEQGGVRRGAQMGVMHSWHPDVPLFIHAKRPDVSLAKQLLLDDPDDPTHNSFGEALEEARDVLEEYGYYEDPTNLPDYLRNAIEGHLNNFNISVAVTDEFMECLRNGEDYIMKNPRTDRPHIATEETKEMWSWFGLGDQVTVGEALSVDPQLLWDDMIEGAHKNGEPGVIYIDRINKHNTFDPEKYPEHKINATNPCGEEPLEDGDACNLNHINLSTIVKEDVTLWPEHEGDIDDFLNQAIDWQELNDRIHTGVHFLDNVVTMSDFPIDNIDKTVQEQRKIGLGIMGLAQLFIQLGVEYGSETSREISEDLMKHIHHTSKDISRLFAEERGTFDNWDESKWANPTEYPDFFKHHAGRKPEDWEDGYPQRNHETTTVAPTGTTSILADTSGGCEPIYNVVYYKNVTDDIQGEEMMVEWDSLFIKTLETNGVDIEQMKEEARELMANNDFSYAGDIPSVPQEIADLFVTTNQLEAKEHAKIQCAVQQGVGSGISKTVNAPSDAKLEDAKDAFEYIYDHDGKSVTYYRDGSRTKQVNTTRKDNQDTEEDEGGSEDAEIVEQRLVREAPKEAPSMRYEIETGYGDMLVNVAEDQYGIVEVTINVGKSGGTVQSMSEAIGRLVSKSLQNGVSPQDVIQQLENIKSQRKGWDNGDSVESVPDGVALALKRHTEEANEMLNHPTSVPSNYEEQSKEEQSEEERGQQGDECPKCGSMALIESEGCEECKTELGGCGYYKCG